MSISNQMNSGVKNIQITKVTNTRVEIKPDLLAVEEPLEIRIGFGHRETRQQRNLSVTMRTPGHDFELVLGFLFTEGIISRASQVETIRYCLSGSEAERENIVRVELKEDVELDYSKFQRHFYTSSSCGVCGKSSLESVIVRCEPIVTHLTLDGDAIHGLPQKLRKSQGVFEHTGGLHASAIFDEESNLVLLREDIGRHNALDKVIGAAICNNLLPLSNSILMLSGRISFELVQKAALAGIPIVAAVGAPSTLAVELAKTFDITLIGFVRDGNFNIYCGETRVK